MVMNNIERATGFVNASCVMSNVLQTLGLTVRQFSEGCGVSYNRISDVVRGRTKKLTPVLVSIMCEAYPQLNKTYLYTGEGNILEDGYMSKTDIHSSSNAIVDKKVSELMRLQQELLNMQKELITRMDEVSKREVAVTKRECDVKIRELAVIEKEAKIEMGKSA